MSLQTHIEHGVMTLSLNRPQRLNAIDAASARELLDALTHAHRANDVRVVVLRGNGRAFCAGRDVSEPPTREILALVQAVASAMVECAKAIVIAVHGWVVGAGVEWMLDGDIVLAARSARFRLPEIEIGVFVTGGITTTLPHSTGLARAKGMLLLGEEFSAEQAQQWGLVWALVDDARLEQETERVARRLASFDPNVLGRFKRVLNDLGLPRFRQGLDAESAMQVQLMQAGSA
jgi:2-(1,2-epoxy-1,2-dihydrophenyl)acetyl-CoA isomerase